jgi:hypothetical protein
VAAAAAGSAAGVSSSGSSGDVTYVTADMHCIMPHVEAHGICDAWMHHWSIGWMHHFHHFGNDHDGVELAILYMMLLCWGQDESSVWNTDAVLVGTLM